MALTKEEINRKMTELFHEVEDITKVDGVDNLPGCEGMLIYEEPGDHHFLFPAFPGGDPEVQPGQ